MATNLSIVVAVTIMHEDDLANMATVAKAMHSGEPSTKSFRVKDE